MSVYVSHDDPGLNRTWANAHVGPRSFRCPVPRCEQAGFGEQPARCPDHPYRDMEEDR